MVLYFGAQLIVFFPNQVSVKKAPAEAGARSSGDVSSIGVAEAELMPLLRISFLLMKAVIVRLKLGHLVALIGV